MSSPLQRPLQSHRNHYLFADYDLDHRVSELPEWRGRRWSDFTPHHDNEAQTEEE